MKLLLHGSLILTGYLNDDFFRFVTIRQFLMEFAIFVDISLSLD